MSNETTPKRSPYAVGLTDEMVRKQRAFFETRVKHPAMDAVIEDLMPLLMPHSESNIIAITGPTGAGKSTLTRHLLKSLMDDFSQLMQDDASTMPLVAVEAYANGDTRHGFKSLFKSMLAEMAEPAPEHKAPAVLVEGRLSMQPTSRETIDGLRRLVESALRQRRTRVGVIDEAAHLLRFAKSSAAMETLKSLANTTGMKWVLVGSFDLFDLVVDDGQVARRSAIVNFDRYHLDRPGDCAAFKEVVRKLQSKWPCEEVPNLVEISDDLLEVSLGCIGLLKSLMLDASAMQLRAGEKWDPNFLKKAAKAMKIRDVIRREIEAGEAKVHEALHGNCIWDETMFSKLVHRMEVGRA